MKLMKQKFIYWQDANLWIGYLEEFPDYWTQGETLEELKENLRDLWRDLASENIPNVRRVSELEVSQPIPRHNEINEMLAKHIIKMLKD
jgi:predicted RNase H-like HicB family nuclease